jgi:hypothetical protein
MIFENAKEVEAYYLGAMHEQERIIAVIQNTIPDCNCALVGMTLCRHNESELMLIGFIKGEALYKGQTNKPKAHKPDSTIK